MLIIDKIVNEAYFFPRTSHVWLQNSLEYRQEFNFGLIATEIQTGEPFWLNSKL